MESEILQKINEQGLDLYRVVQAAAKMGALNSNSILPGRVQDVLDACARDQASKIEIQEGSGLDEIVDPETGTQTTQSLAAIPATRVIDPLKATELAEKLDFPVSPSEWNQRKNKYEKLLHLNIPTAETIIEYYTTWEGFWDAAGFDMEQYSSKDIIDLTLEARSKGFFARKEFDSAFPDLPSSSYVLQSFGDCWKSYGDAVEKVRKKENRPGERIRELLEKGLPVKAVQKSIVHEFREDPDTPLLFQKATNTLYKHICQRKKHLEQEQDNKRLTREEIAGRYDSLEAIAHSQIKSFRHYNGRHKAEKRQQMAEDIVEHLVSIEGNAPRLSYLGLEAANFQSYILLQQMLSGTEPAIDPATSLVVEKDRYIATAMSEIIRNHDVIDGGEIFDGLRLDQNYLHYALDYNKDKRFDVINLDYMGGWSSTKETELEILFRNGQIADNALLYVTLLNSNVEKHRVKNGARNRRINRKGYGTDDQRALLTGKIDELCEEHGYEFVTLHEEEYFDSHKMLFFGFYIEKKQKR